MKKMKHIKLFEELNGVEVPNYAPPMYGIEIERPINKSANTTVLFCEMDNQYYTEYDYQSLYQDYLGDGGQPINNCDNFTEENLNFLVQYFINKKGDS